MNADVRRLLAGVPVANTAAPYYNILISSRAATISWWDRRFRLSSSGSIPELFVLPAYRLAKQAYPVSFGGSISPSNNVVSSGNALLRYKTPLKKNRIISQESSFRIGPVNGHALRKNIYLVVSMT